MLSYNDVAAKAEEYVQLCLSSSYAKEQQIVHLITAENYAEVLNDHNAGLITAPRTTLKIEHFESFDEEVWKWCQHQAILAEHDGPVTAHVFVSPADGYTFNQHTDPDDVLLVVLAGLKMMDVDGKTRVIRPGKSLFIPANTPHYAINAGSSMMISLGFEKWMASKL